MSARYSRFDSPPDSRRTTSTSSAIPTHACGRARSSATRECRHRLEQLARARDGEARRERGAQPAVGRAVPALLEREALVDRARRLLAQPRRHLAQPRPSCICRRSRACPISASASNTTSVSCTVSIVRTVVVPESSSSAAASRGGGAQRRGRVRRFQRPDARPQPLEQRHVVGEAAKQRLAEMDVRLDEAGKQVARRRVDDRVAPPLRLGTDRRRSRRRGRTTAPSTMSSASFIVRIVALRMSVELMAGRRDVSGAVRLPGGGRSSAASRSSTPRLVSTPRRTAISSARMLIAISAGVTAPMSRPIGACTRSQALGRHALGEQRVVDARDLRPAADQAEVFEVARGQRAHAPRGRAWWPRVTITTYARRRRSRRGAATRRSARRSLLGAGKALGVGELLAVVDDVDAEAGVGGELRRGASRRGRRR